MNSFKIAMDSIKEIKPKFVNAKDHLSRVNEHINNLSSEHSINVKKCEEELILLIPLFQDKLNESIKNSKYHNYNVILDSGMDEHGNNLCNKLFHSERKIIYKKIVPLVVSPFTLTGWINKDEIISANKSEF